MEHIFSASGLKFMDFISYPDFNIEKNKTTFICGESGSGKSTLFKLMNASLSPSQGTLLYMGKDIAKCDTLRLRRNVSLISQEPYLFNGTVKENFETYFSYRGMPAPGEDTIKRFLSLCCFDLPLDTDCRNLSGGERQRVYLAIFLSFPAEVFLLDEPTASLDEQTAFNVINNIKNHCTVHGITLVIISHDRSLVGKFADKVIELEKGAGI
ncbi:MAG: ATP-binding cassette domain-containing protein [Clostridiales bacterium]|nr:ATP-binding cassette domain-containing protein [Clostridiales bacterium]